MTRRPVVEAGYVVIVALLAAAGAVLQQPQYYLAAVVLTLPLGLAALVGVYLGYALIQALGGLFLATTTADGSQAPWLAITSSALNVILLTAAAAANPHLLRAVRKALKSAHSTGAAGGWAVRSAPSRAQPVLSSQESREGQDLRD